MIRWLLHKLTQRFEQRYQYDGGYMHHVYNVSSGAGLRLSALPLLSQYRGPSADVWAGAALASTLDGDCGPCAQLIVDMSLESGVAAHELAACVAGDISSTGDVALGFRFASAAINDDLAANDLREQIIQRHGEEAAVAAAFAAATARAYPVLKRALGHGAACTRLSVGSQGSITVTPVSTA